MVTRKKFTTADVARKAEAATVEACHPHPCVVWMDNYNKQRYSNNPGVVPSKANQRKSAASDSNASINGAVLAVFEVLGSTMCACSEFGHCLESSALLFPAPSRPSSDLF